MLAVNDLVMREREDIVLGKGIHHRETELIVMPCPRIRVSREIIEGIMHPAHIPLMCKAETAFLDGMRYLGPCG